MMKENEKFTEDNIFDCLEDMVNSLDGQQFNKRKENLRFIMSSKNLKLYRDVCKKITPIIPDETYYCDIKILGFDSTGCPDDKIWLVSNGKEMEESWNNFIKGEM